MEIGMNIGGEDLILSILDSYYPEGGARVLRPREALSNFVYLYETRSGVKKNTYVFRPINPREVKFIFDVYFGFVPNSIVLYNQIMSVIPTGDNVEVSGFFSKNPLLSVTIGDMLDPFVFMLCSKIHPGAGLAEIILQIEQFFD